ncbi:hypothetical protein COCC4DRAFT_31105 [Bipolaris maydis ATCC 48331]|uniref:Uncharacterized protein n=2 Tax=Cochliobolus heterostrophus TaxID=5016 RepID=M2V103_COCH5|nr:uncharacterized protein COCC4DRAFT_31105 [Bipolaris maydis ATCC 48331]EMD93647.1 hypothetical protein COCHEDRAFT_1020600 [Bipolaris maydis C5]KAJ5027949.1 hypothetical protein J3E73DRAFT_296994 [Bipolaris maydis]ENI06908.1 hypothetical protein COCC4DRAFT_31105 [Bipolaris maydis ATCC 48331]KAJ6266413.1 hypothetical protein PSV08DRAFT_331209 [Bipolaris maydis]KAJ6283255.1 hypothetical protein J3E71DRAFT_280539 [Bipolaris maydis]
MTMGLHGIQVAFLVRDDWGGLSVELNIRLKSTMPTAHEWPCVSEIVLDKKCCMLLHAT